MILLQNYKSVHAKNWDISLFLVSKKSLDYVMLLYLGPMQPIFACAKQNIALSVDRYGSTIDVNVVISQPIS